MSLVDRRVRGVHVEGRLVLARHHERGRLHHWIIGRRDSHVGHGVILRILLELLTVASLLVLFLISLVLLAFAE